jgi:hypothetical protein
LIETVYTYGDGPVDIASMAPGVIGLVTAAERGHDVFLKCRAYNGFGGLAAAIGVLVST